MNKNLVRKSDVLSDVRNSLNNDSSDLYCCFLKNYGCYCKDEEIERWNSACDWLIKSIPGMSDQEWLEEADTLENTGRVMECLSLIQGENDWDFIRDIVDTQEHTVDSLCTVSELLIAYSPMGMEFVDNIVRPMEDFKKMRSLKAAYDTEKNRLMRKEMVERRELGKRLIRVLSVRKNNLSMGE